jgi:methionyl-tRNA synthetase
MLDQLNVSIRTKIPEQWEQDILKPGHKLGTSKHLFHQIPRSRVEEWRPAIGGDEVRK